MELVENIKEFLSASNGVPKHVELKLRKNSLRWFLRWKIGEMLEKANELLRANVGEGSEIIQKVDFGTNII